jgi:hypothetical protein
MERAKQVRDNARLLAQNVVNEVRDAPLVPLEKIAALEEVVRQLQRESQVIRMEALSAAPTVWRPRNRSRDQVPECGVM